MIDPRCLGKTQLVQERRYNVLSLLLKGAKPREITDILKLSDNQVKNDIFHLTNTPLNNMPVDIAKDFNTSWYEVKIRELEGRLKDFKTDSRSWLATQELIRKYKADSLKLQGLMNDKLDIKVDPITVTNIDIDEKLAEKFGNWLATKKEEDIAE